MSVAKYESTCVDPQEYTEYLKFVDIFDSRRFYSHGKNGTFELRTIITRLKSAWDTDVFNLSFGVWDKSRRIIDDKIRTRNDDMLEILATVADSALAFLHKHPGTALYAEGSTLARTRLYQREIAKILDSIPSELCINGLITRDEVGFVEFRPNINYDAFLLSAK